MVDINVDPLWIGNFTYPQKGFTQDRSGKPMIFLGKYSTFIGFPMVFLYTHQQSFIFHSYAVHIPKREQSCRFPKMWLPQSSSHHPYSFFPCSRNISINHPAIASNVGKTMPCLPPMTGNCFYIPPIYLWWWLGGIVLPTLPQFMEAPHWYFSAQAPQDILEGLKAKWEQVGARSLDHAGSWLCQGSDHPCFCFLMLSHIVEHTDLYKQCNYIVYIYIYVKICIYIYIYIYTHT